MYDKNNEIKTTEEETQQRREEEHGGEDVTEGESSGLFDLIATYEKRKKNTHQTNTSNQH